MNYVTATELQCTTVYGRLTIKARKLQQVRLNDLTTYRLNVRLNYITSEQLTTKNGRQ